MLANFDHRNRPLTLFFTQLSHTGLIIDQFTPEGSVTSQSVEQGSSELPTVRTTTAVTTTSHRAMSASHVVVLDSRFRKTVVKVTPSTQLTDVLHEACTKLDLDPEQHALR